MIHIIVVEDVECDTALVIGLAQIVVLFFADDFAQVLDIPRKI